MLITKHLGLLSIAAMSLVAATPALAQRTGSERGIILQKGVGKDPGVNDKNQRAGVVIEERRKVLPLKHKNH